MDFHALIAKINTINNAPSTRQITQESEFPMMGNASAPVGGPLSPPPHPSMHVNIDAQGVDNIEDIFRLMQKLNPDMDQTKRLSTPLPTPISPIPGTTDFDDDMDDINDDMDDVDSDMDDELDHKMHELEGDLDSDGDVDNDDLEGDDEIILGGSFDSSTDEDGGFQSSTTRPSSRYRDMDYMNDELAGGMNGPKKTYPKVAGGDNPMQSMDESRSRFYEAIRSDLRSRLAEAKKASEGMTKKEKSAVVKKAKSGGDIGKPGKNFDKVAKAAGGGEKGKKIAAAAMWKQQAKK